MVSTAEFHARAGDSFPGLGGLKETKMFLPHPLVKLSIVRSLHDRELACSASDLQGLNFVHPWYNKKHSVLFIAQMEVVSAVYARGMMMTTSLRRKSGKPLRR